MDGLEKIIEAYETDDDVDVELMNKVSILRWAADTLENGDIPTPSVADHLANKLREVAKEFSPSPAGWQAALVRTAEQWGCDLDDVASFFMGAVSEWQLDAEETHIFIDRADLIESDSYGVDGSDFFRCKLCGQSSGAGLLNKGIPHLLDCRIFDYLPEEK